MPTPAGRPTLLDRHLLFVTGKGGVGKTSVAAAIASLAASSGRRTLLCEMDAKGAAAGAFDATPFEFEPRLVERNLWAMSMNTEDSLREYLRLFIRVPLMARIGPLARTLDFVADAAPGVKEILGVGKIAYEVRERHYDLVVVDAEASGHIVAQIAAPRTIADLVQVGMVRDQTRWMLEILDDPSRTGVVIVTTPEEMPVNETLELIDRLAAETSTEVAAVVANRVMPERFDPGDAELVDTVTSDEGVAERLAAACGPAVSTVLAAARVAQARHRIGAGHLDRLRAGLGDVPVIEVPEMFTRATGRRVVAKVAAAIRPQLEGDAR